MTIDGFSWDRIDDVLLDMDGTLLDRDFDNFFFEEALPRRYAALHGLPFEEARDRLMTMYRSVEGELAWTDLHYWSRRVGIDVVAMHRELDHMIRFLPGAEGEFESLLRGWCEWLAERGTTELAIYTSEGARNHDVVTKLASQIDMYDLRMDVRGNRAWVNHNERSTAPDGTVSESYEIRLLEKVDGSWKLVGQSIHIYRIVPGK